MKPALIVRFSGAVFFTALFKTFAREEFSPPANQVVISLSRLPPTGELEQSWKMIDDKFCLYLLKVFNFQQIYKPLEQSDPDRASNRIQIRFQIRQRTCPSSFFPALLKENASAD